MDTLRPGWLGTEPLNEKVIKMTSSRLCYGIIPARYQSSRFPGKALADILGKPMFWHVFDRSRRCPLLREVYLATDDDRIFSAAEHLGVPVVMTKRGHRSGTDRVLEAAEKLQIPSDAVVVNIQGDEPTLNPSMISRLLRPFEDPDMRVATLAHTIDRHEAESPDRVTVVMSKSGKGLYFSRAMLPHHLPPAPVTLYEHVGLYAFRMDTLKLFVALGPGRLESIENLEMLRLIENDIPIQVEITEVASMCVDHPKDLVRVTELLKHEHT